MGIQINGFDNLIKELDKLSKKAYVDEVTKKAVNAAKDVVASSMRSAIASSEYGPRSTGSVAASVVATDAKVNSYGTYSVAKPTGRDEEGKRNGEKAAYLEYGSPKKPALAEAMALNFADNTDAKMETFTELVNSTQETGWLGYNRMFESNIRVTQVD